MNSVPSNLAALLASRRTEDRIQGVTLLTRSDLPEKGRLLLQTLDDRSHYVAALAAEALKDEADLSVCAAMVEKFLWFSEDGLKRDPGCHIRGHLAFALGRLEYGSAAEALRVGIRAVQIEPVGGVPFDTGAHLRANCALALAQIGAPDALRDISLLLFDMGGNALAGDRNAALVRMEPRKAAAQALARTGDRSALLPLALKLAYPSGESPEVLQECMLAILELEDERALELLTPYLRHSDELLAAYAALMIARTRAPEASALLREAAERLSGNALQAAILALATLRTEEARAVLHAFASDAREAARLAVVDALHGTQDESDRRILELLAVKDRSLAVRNAAKRALSS